MKYNISTLKEGQPMRSRYQFLSGNDFYFITMTIVEWIPVFTRAKYCDIFIDALRFSQENKGLKVHAFVLLDNHAHLIVSGADLSKIFKEFKSYTATQLIKKITFDDRQWLLNQLSYWKKRYKTDSIHQVWQEGVHPQMIVSEKMLRQKIEYIHNNPVKTGLVAQPEHWVYSSASNYFLGQGIFNVELIKVH